MRQLRDLAIVLVIVAAASAVCWAHGHWQAQSARGAVTAMYAQLDAHAMQNDYGFARQTITEDYSSRLNGRTFSRSQHLYMMDRRSRQVGEFDIRPVRFKTVIKALDVPAADCVVAHVEVTDEVSIRTTGGFCGSDTRNVVLNASEKRETWLLHADGWKRVYTEGTTVRRTFDGEPVEPTEWMKDIP